MWEAIQSNIRRSRAIVVAMAMLLVVLGALVGATWMGGLEGAAAGAVGALMLLSYGYVRLLRGTLTPSLFGAGQVFWYFVVGLWPLLYWLVYL